MMDGTGADQDQGGTENGSDEPIEVVSLFSGKMREALESLEPRLRLCSEDELYGYAEPTPNDWNLRRSFHAKVLEAIVKEDKAITTTSIYDGIMTRQYFFEKILPNPNKMAFISRPIIEHTAYYEAIHREGLRKIFDWVRDTKLNEKNFSQFMKIVEKAGDRAHGAVAQKMQIQSKNLNVDMKGELPPPSHDSSELQKKVEHLQNKLLGQGIKDVTPTDASEDPI